METQAPEITVDATIGQVISPSTTPTPTTTSSPTAVATHSSVPVSSTPLPTGFFYTPVPDRHFAGIKMIIYGYGPPNSAVNLKGIGISEHIKADKSGYFVFDGIYSHSLRYPELCLQAVDGLNRVTQPSCIPGLPVDRNIPYYVGPILLSPTVSLNDNRVVVGDHAFISGQTSPDVEVLLYISTGPKKLSFVNTAYAYTFPEVSGVKADENGEFTIGLPTTQVSDYKLFVAGKYGEDYSAKSTTLDFSVVGSIRSGFDNLMQSIQNNKMMIVIFIEIILVVILLLMALKRTTVRIKRHTEKDYLESIK